MKAYVGPYFEFEVNVQDLRGTPYPSSQVAEKLLAVVRLRPKVLETRKEVVRRHIIAFIPKKWAVGESSVSEDNIFPINLGSAVEAQNTLYYHYEDELAELEAYLNCEVNIRFGFVSLE